ncbi:PXA domain protein [Tuber indicum]|nr:PXA domain protein [Tuber indicum]
MKPFRPSPVPAVDKSAIALIRRVLCYHAPPFTPLEQLLPALTSSPEVDLELYAFLAIIFRDFIYSWYSKITTDNAFADEIIAVVAHCSRAIEERVRKVDLEALFLDEIPSFIENHVQDYRLALSRHSTPLSPHLAVREIFHNFQPHPALSSSPDSEKLYLKLVSSGILAVLLPTEDLESDCERSLVREVLSEMVLWNAVDRLSEPHIIHEIITNTLELLRAPMNPLSAPEPPSENERKPPVTHTRRKRSYSEKIPPIPLPHEPNGSVKNKRFQAPEVLAPPPANYKLIRIHPVMDNLLTIAFKVLSLLRTYLSSFITNLHSPPPPPPRPKKPLLRMSLFRLIPSYLHLPTLQPWTLSSLLFLTKPFTSRSTRLGLTLDNLLSSSFHSYIESPKLLVKILRSARSTLFPASPEPVRRAHPTPKEKARIKYTAEEAIWEATPSSIRKVYFGTDDKEEGLLVVGEMLLKTVQDKEVNKHLLYNLLDLIVGKLIPELTEEGPAELRRSRVGVVDR